MPDLFAIIGTFLELSKEHPLDLTVWYHPSAKWSDLSSILKRKRHLVHTLNILWPNTLYKAPKETNMWHSQRYYTAVSTILSTCGPLRDLRKLTFDYNVAFNRQQFTALHLPACTRILSNIHLSPEDLSTDNMTVWPLTAISTNAPIGHVVSTLGSFPHLSYLEFEETSDSEHDISHFPSLPKQPRHLRKISFNRSYSRGIESLLRLLAPQIAHLHLWMSSQFADLISTLRELSNLRELRLEFSLGTPESGSILESGVKINSLQVLEIRTPYSATDVASNRPSIHIATFLWALGNLYPRIHSVSITGFRSILILAREFFWSLSTVDSLSLKSFSRGSHPTTITLPTLSEFNLDNPPALKSFDMPNLHCLQIQNVKFSNNIRNIGYRGLYRIFIQAEEPSGLLFLRPEEYPELSEVHLELDGIHYIWRVTSLPHLVLITITSRTFLNPQGNLQTILGA
ncbi:hypothetical protein M408DRAFT_26916 [Serendipita vermifera MAFF 305830]|uniref:F-box domain-containing protein n=1 Tax=Serendipita vermifera MAFF 305830 TaxID=933852 RepID=A0A0C2WDW5_SERVB|nr:hypothetical protein M408DRAFT_26916 [Serendipita vermifera MAFF 305830]